MNRFKFRHYDTRLKEMRYSDKHDGEFYVNTKGVMYMYAIPKSESGLETKYYKSYKVNMFTGILDNQSKRVYEKDILEVKIEGDWQSNRYVVDIAEDLHFHMNRDDMYHRINEIKVVGNIYENKDLV